MDGKLVTIIIPVYNGEKYIEKSINSIISQTYENIEILIINDGSTDKTEEILKKISHIDSRLHIIKINNQGVSYARNYGRKLAKGDYIMFVDADDYIEPETVESMLDIAEEKKADVVQCGYKVVSDSEIKERFSSEFAIYSKDKAIQFYLEKFQLCVVPWNKLIKKEISEIIDFPIERRYEDEAVMYKLFYETSKVVNVKE